MARNFCGFVDLDTQVNEVIAKKMADKLNFGKLYKTGHSKYPSAHLVNLYSESFPEPGTTTFIKEIQDRYGVVSFSILVCRNELIKKLGDCVGLVVASDEELILRAYLKWGKEAVHQLEGDWAFAIWDNDNQELFLARNQHADGTLFYYQEGSRLYFSSMLTGLVDIEGIPKELDKEKFFMECFRYSGFKSKTIYKDIHFLKPGHHLAFSHQSLQLSQYWHVMNVPATRFKKEEEYAEAFFESYDRAVRSRIDLNNRWIFSLSGGLDSGATMGMVCRYLKEKNECLEAMTYLPADSSFDQYRSGRLYGDETEFTTESARFNGNVNLEFTRKEGRFWQEMIDYTRDFGAPPHIANVWYSDALAQKAKSKGVNTVMTAQGGNQGLSYPGIPSYKNLAQFKRDINDGLSLSGQDYAKFLLKALYGTGRGIARNSSWKKKARILRVINEITLLSPDFVESIDGHKLLEEYHYQKRNGLSPAEYKFKKSLGPGRHCRLGAWNQIGSRYDLVFIDPSRDTKFLELVASFPNHIFNRNGEPKFIYKQAFKEVVSPKIMHNKRRGLNMSDIISIYQADLEGFKNLLDAKDDNDVYRSMFDMDKVRGIYERLKNENTFPESFVYSLADMSNPLFLALLM